MKDIIKNKLGLKYYDENNNIKNNKIQRNNNDYIRQNNIIQHDINESNDKAITISIKIIAILNY